MLTYLGLTVLAGLIIHLLWAYRKCSPAGKWHGITAVGFVVILVGHISQVLHFAPVYIHLTPWMWTGFILFVDGINYRVAGNSLILSRRKAFWVLLPFSIAFWVLFEIYNLKLVNWVYVGLPDNLVHRYFGYAWAFATILPAIFEAAELYHNLVFRDSSARKPLRFSQSFLNASVLTGLVFLVAPPLFERTIAVYLFGFVWLGIIFALDPWNLWSRRRSLTGDLLNGRWDRLASLWWSGVLCGVLWEFWNYWAFAKWFYVFPILQGVKIFEMPLLGYVGFPFFALECFVFSEMFLGGRLPGFLRMQPLPALQRDADVLQGVRDPVPVSPK